MIPKLESSTNDARKRAERFYLAALLKRLYPRRQISVEDSEKPDFVLTLDNQTVGVETTFSVDQEYVRAQKLHFTVCPQECIITTNLKDGSRRRSNEELLHDMFDIDQPWKDVGQDLIDWKKKIEKTVTTKRERFNQSDFQRFDQNWLLVCDMPSLANDVVTYDLALRHLANLFTNLPAVENDFEIIFIYSEKYLFRWKGMKLSLHYDRS